MNNFYKGVLCAFNTVNTKRGIDSKWIPKEQEEEKYWPFW